MKKLILPLITILVALIITACDANLEKENVTKIVSIAVECSPKPTDKPTATPSPKATISVEKLEEASKPNEVEVSSTVTSDIAQDKSTQTVLQNTETSQNNKPIEEPVSQITVEPTIEPIPEVEPTKEPIFPAPTVEPTPTITPTAQPTPEPIVEPFNVDRVMSMIDGHGMTWSYSAVTYGGYFTEPVSEGYSAEDEEWVAGMISYEYAGCAAEGCPGYYVIFDGSQFVCYYGG